MATVKQIEANRRNAQKSTGPKTEAGKDSSRHNALKHGLGGVYLMLPHENPADYAELRANLQNTWQPANAQEMMLVDQIAQSHWRIQRGRRFETSMFNYHVRKLKATNGMSEKPRHDDDNAIAVVMGDKVFETSFNLLSRYDARAESAYYRAIDRLRQLQNDRRRREKQQEKEVQQTIAKAHPDTIAEPSGEPPPPNANPLKQNIELGSFGEDAKQSPAPRRQSSRDGKWKPGPTPEPFLKQ